MDKDKNHMDSMWSRDNLCAFIMALLSLCLIVYFRPPLENKPHGILLPAATAMPTLEKDALAVLFSPAPEAIHLGALHVEKHYQQHSRDGQQQVLDYARQLAADYGANAVVADTFGYTRDGTNQSVYLLEGSAVYLP